MSHAQVRNGNAEYINTRGHKPTAIPGPGKQRVTTGRRRERKPPTPTPPSSTAQA